MRPWGQQCAPSIGGLVTNEKGSVCLLFGLPHVARLAHLIELRHTGGLVLAALFGKGVGVITVPRVAILLTLTLCHHPAQLVRLVRGETDGVSLLLEFPEPAFVHLAPPSRPWCALTIPRAGISHPPLAWG